MHGRVVGTIALLVLHASASLGCNLAGSYVRAASEGPEATLQVDMTPNRELEFSLHTYGVRLFDGTSTFGALAGKLERSKCTAVYNSVEEDCKLVMRFQRTRVTIHQLGSCNFGEHASATGVYSRAGSSKSAP